MKTEGDYGADPFGPTIQAAEYADRITTPEQREAQAANIEHLQTHGYVVLENVIPRETLDDARAALDGINTTQDFAKSTFLGEKTQRPYGLLGKSPAI